MKVTSGMSGVLPFCRYVAIYASRTCSFDASSQIDHTLSQVDILHFCIPGLYALASSSIQTGGEVELFLAPRTPSQHCSKGISRTSSVRNRDSRRS